MKNILVQSKILLKIKVPLISPTQISRGLIQGTQRHKGHKGTRDTNVLKKAYEFPGICRDPGISIYTNIVTLIGKTRRPLASLTDDFFKTLVSHSNMALTKILANTNITTLQTLWTLQPVL